MRSVLVTLLISGVLGGTVSAQSVFGGRVVAGQERAGILVSLVRENGQIVDQTFTNVRGAFQFDEVPFRDLVNDTYVYLVVEEEGFQPLRQRINQIDIRGSGTITVFLEALVSETDSGDGELTVDLSQLVTDIPDNARAEYAEALDDARSGDHERAAGHLERAVELAPGYYEAWVDLGAEYTLLGRLEDAVAAFLGATEANPAGALAPMNLGALYFQQGDRERAREDPAARATYREARNWFERSVQLDPASPEAQYYLGATHFRLDEYAEAEQWLQRAVESDGNGAARLLLINLYARGNFLEDALRQARAFVDENPEAAESESIGRLIGQLEDALGR